MRHPEQREGEVWVFNTPLADFDKSRWETRRAGTTAYGGQGKQIAGLVPVFIAKAEVLAKADEYDAKGEQLTAKLLLIILGVEETA